MTKRVYGIDLGTTYSCIAYVDEHGKPTVVANAEGEQTTPSVVYFESPDNVVVGRTAKDAIVLNQERVVSTIKRHMGDKTFEFSIDGRTYRPEEISSNILRKLVNDASAITGDEIKDVVITCPAYFGVAEIEATKRAGTIAGLNVLYVIPEPTAAAIAYQIDLTEPQNILVYDLGGGTFDVTLIRVSSREITVVATDGDVRLGGADWDEDIVGFLAREFETQTSTPAQELTGDVETYQQLLKDAEGIKVRLSTATKVSHKFYFKSDSAVVELTRDKFEELTMPRLQQTVNFLESMIKLGEARGIGKDKINKLLLVGGSTYMPQIKSRLSSYGFEIVQFDPNQAVAKGAAIFGHRAALEERIVIKLAEQTGQAADSIDLAAVTDADRQSAARKVAAEEGMTLPSLEKLIGPRISNVTSKSFGVVVIDDDATKRKVVRNLVVIQDPVPKNITERFSTNEDGQSDVEIRIMQNKQATDKAELSDCNPDPVGTAVLTFARPLPKGSPIEITFRLGPDGRLSVHGRDLTTNGEIDAEFEMEGVMSNEEVEQARSRALSMTVV